MRPLTVSALIVVTASGLLALWGVARPAASHRAAQPPAPSAPAPVVMPERYEPPPIAPPIRSAAPAQTPIPPPAPAAIEFAALTPPPTSPVARADVAKLDRCVDARFANRALLEIMELLREECGLEFIYDESLVTRLQSTRMSMEMANARARDVLDFMCEIADISVEYMNGRVWIKPAAPK